MTPKKNFVTDIISLHTSSEISARMCKQYMEMTLTPMAAICELCNQKKVSTSS